MESRHRRWTVLLSATVLTTCLTGVAPGWRGVQSRDLVVTDLAGRRLQPFAATGIRATVFVFTRTDCPMVANAWCRKRHSGRCQLDTISGRRHSG